MKEHFTNKGFTLIELLVVVSIIGMLASLILPPLQNTRTKAQEKAFFAEARSLAVEAEIFATDAGTYAPESFSGSGRCPTETEVGDPAWGFLASEQGMAILSSMKNRLNISDNEAGCAVSPNSWAISFDFFDDNLFAQKDTFFVSKAYAQEKAGYVCVDSSNNVKTSKSFLLDSSGEERHPSKPLESIEMLPNGDFVCR